MWVAIVVGAVVVLLLVFLVYLYNRLVRLRNETETGWANIDVQLRRRYDLVPNLVEAVKGYAAHERETLQAVVDARTKANQVTISPETLKDPEALDRKSVV